MQPNCALIKLLAVTRYVTVLCTMHSCYRSNECAPSDRVHSSHDLVTKSALATGHNTNNAQTHSNNEVINTYVDVGKLIYSSNVPNNYIQP